MTIASNRYFSFWQPIQYRDIVEEIPEQPLWQQTPKKWKKWRIVEGRVGVAWGEAEDIDQFYTPVPSRAGGGAEGMVQRYIPAHTPPRAEKIRGRKLGWRVFCNTWENEVKDEIDALLVKARDKDWDGNDALPLTPDVGKVALQFVSRIPLHISKPDVDVTPFGEIGFDWFAKNIVFSVNIGPHGEIAFAGRFYKTRVRGNEQWQGELPEFVDCCFERLIEAKTS